MEPTRAAHEHEPMAAFLTTVGSNSPVNMNTTPNAAEAPALPISARVMVTAGSPEKEMTPSSFRKVCSLANIL